MRRILWCSAAGLTVALGAAIPHASAATTGVLIENFAYKPTPVVVQPGDTITWTNKDSTGHSVTADDGSFDSDPSGACTPLAASVACTQQNQTYSRQFNSTGSFAYHCKAHPGMKGTVVVQAPAVTTTRAGATTTRPGATTTRAGATTSTAAGATTTSVLGAGSPITVFDETSTSAPPGTAVAKTKGGGGGGSGAVVAIVAALIAVAAGGGALLWRLRPRTG